MKPTEVDIAEICLHRRCMTGVHSCYIKLVTPRHVTVPERGLAPKMSGTNESIKKSTMVKSNSVFLRTDKISSLKYVTSARIIRHKKERASLPKMSF